MAEVIIGDVETRFISYMFWKRKNWKALSVVLALEGIPKFSGSLEAQVICYFPLTSDRRGNNTRVVSVWRRLEQVVADFLFSAAGDSEHVVHSFGPTTVQ